jgi:hypothetical protein
MRIGKCLSEAGSIQNGLGGKKEEEEEEEEEEEKKEIPVTIAFPLWFRVYYCGSARQCIP